MSGGTTPREGPVNDGPTKEKISWRTIVISSVLAPLVVGFVGWGADKIFDGFVIKLWGGVAQGDLIFQRHFANQDLGKKPNEPTVRYSCNKGAEPIPDGDDVLTDRTAPTFAIVACSAISMPGGSHMCATKISRSATYCYVNSCGEGPNLGGSVHKWTVSINCLNTTNSRISK